MFKQEKCVNNRIWMVAVILSAILAIGTPPASALDLNGFLRAKGKGTVAPSFTSESYDQFWRGTTKVDTPAGLGEVDTQSWALWFAYGITDKLTIFGNVPYVDTEGDGTGNMSQSDIQDLSLLAAYRLVAFGKNDRQSVVGAIGVQTPLTDYVTNAPVAVGDGTTDGLLRFVYQYRLPHFYFSQQVGWDLRSGGAPNGFPFATEVGGTIAGRLTLSGFYTLYLAESGLDIGGPGFTDQFGELQEEFERAGAKAYVRIGGGFGATVAYYFTIDGRNTGDSSGGSIGVVYDF